MPSRDWRGWSAPQSLQLTQLTGSERTAVIGIAHLGHLLGLQQSHRRRLDVPDGASATHYSQTSGVRTPDRGKATRRWLSPQNPSERPDGRAGQLADRIQERGVDDLSPAEKSVPGGDVKGGGDHEPVLVVEEFLAPLLPVGHRQVECRVDLGGQIVGGEAGRPLRVPKSPPTKRLRPSGAAASASTPPSKSATKAGSTTPVVASKAKSPRRARMAGPLALRTWVKLPPT